jgi:hypothetical protein
MRALFRESLFLLFLGGKRSLGGLRLGGALLELVHATGRIHKLLLPRVKRMAHVANTDDDSRLRGTRLDHVATRATDLRIHIFWMNVCFHKKAAQRNTEPAKHKGKIGIFEGKSPKSTPRSAEEGVEIAELKS